jgi:hypothetical protein
MNPITPSLPMWRRVLIAVAVVFIALTAAYVMCGYLREVAAASAGPKPQQALMEMEKGFRLAVAQTSLDERIGFDVGSQVDASKLPDGLTGVYYIAQYSAAPRVVVTDPNRRLTLVFRPTEEALLRYVDEAHLNVLAHTAPGIALVERPQK